MPNLDFQDILKKFRDLAGGRLYARGEEYFEEGLVGAVTEKNGAIFAKMHGIRSYLISISLSGSR